MKENEVGVAYGIYGGEEECVQAFCGEHEVRLPFGRLGVNGKIQLI